MAGLLVTMALTLACAAAPTVPEPAPAKVVKPCDWPLWSAYVGKFVEADGRVVDHFAQHSTSEGQAYGMFHALVARDAKRFAKILAWTEKHLAKGDLGAHLPAWKWALRDGKGVIIDPNAASDADLIMAYSLVHAAVVFDEVRYAELGGKLLALIAAREVKQLPGLGPMLMPGPHGFDTTPGFLRVNPSYQPIPLLRWAARIDPSGPWAGIVESAVKLAEDATPERFYPDWAAYSEVTQRFVSDPLTGGLGSYDAIRAYLWPALMVPEDPMRGRLLARGSRLLEAVRTKGFVPEKVDAFDPAKNVQLAAGPVGFQVVGQVFAQALGDAALATALGEKVAAAQQVDGLYGEPPFYYDHNLLLFAQGFLEGRFRFALNGSLELGGARCASE
jgi:endo-1,4-beta-D-glucanase Y